jgi:hypothetical protein
MFNNHKPWLYKQIPIEQLITSNLDDSDARHLMVIGKSDSIVNLLTYQLRMRDLDPVVILGSQFPDDRDDYYYSVLRRIMVIIYEKYSFFYLYYVYIKHDFIILDVR